MIETAVYYFPNYHADARNEKLHGPGWTEWELVKRAEPRFPGHQQPKIPAWNEWTEGSYLEPDLESGMSYLEAIRDVFGPSSNSSASK
jgi:hypothetical protein